MTDLLELGALTRQEEETCDAIRRQDRAARHALGAPSAERAESRDSAHALVARAVVQLRTAMATLKDANHAADPVTAMHTVNLIRDLGAVEFRVVQLERAMAMQGKRA